MKAEGNPSNNASATGQIDIYDRGSAPSTTVQHRDASRFALDVSNELNISDRSSAGEPNMDEEGIEDPVSLEQGVADYDIVQSPRRDTNADRLLGFASLKTKTFDNNFKDLEGLKRKKELLHLSENYLYSKLYTPKLEALQRLVEPGRYTDQAQHRFDTGSLSTATVHSRSPSTSKEDKGHASSSSSGRTTLSAQAVTTYASQWNQREVERPSSLQNKHTGGELPSLQARGERENLVTLVTSSEVVNGIKKKRITIPKAAYQPLRATENKANKVRLGVVGNAKVEEELSELDGAESWLRTIENHIEKLTDSIELCGNTVTNPKEIIEQLEAMRPSWMPEDIFYLYCMKPIGMEPHEFLKCLDTQNIDEFREASQKFNIVNTNAMGYVLDAENETVEELTKLNKVHKRLVNEHDIYTKIHMKMTENFNNQVEDLLQITRQDLRLAAGDTYLQYGSIKNITTWKRGDPVIREKGFCHDKASKDKMKTLQRMQEVFGEGSNVAYDSSTVDEAKYIYYMKLLQDMEDSERDELQQQLARDRTQALAEYSVLEPAFKPDGCLAWKAVGVSCKSVIWKMYNTVECVPVIYKLKSLKGASAEVVAKLQKAYEQTFETLKQLEPQFSSNKHIKFANGFEITANCVAERMAFIRDTPVSELVEKMAQMKPAERYVQAQVIVREITKMVNQLQNIDFLLPLKSSRVYFFAGGAKLSAGIPQSVLSIEARQTLKQYENVTIASLLWGKNLEWYLPPEADGEPAFTRDPIAVSKAHVWMIGKILYEATCQTPLSRVALDYNKIELCDDADTREFLKLCLQENVSQRPTVEEIVRHPFMKRHKVNYGALGPVDVGKVQCAVEILGDIETIVLNKINRTEKGVADYEQNDNWDTVLGESDDEDLWPLGNKDAFKFPTDNNIVFKK
ncbi:kinase domain containing protein, putative [Babesia ovis]|uniref:Kinase domain containing protein, putative n=1 Tax=Babesia ovis TaxID=5869 RepID=A0A9W5WU90_BABOV|nr:kinase domain containing protein, putative [Babesia ovis]